MNEPFVINMKKPQNNTEDLADHHSDSQGSQQQDDLFLDPINFEILNFCEYYDPNNEENFIQHAKDSEMVAKNIVDKIVNNGAEGMYHKYIDNKIDDHIWEKIRNQVMNSQVQEFLDYDNYNDQAILEIEEEPPATYKDTWNRNQIETMAEPAGYLSVAPQKNWGIDMKLNSSFTSTISDSKMYQSLTARQTKEFNAQKPNKDKQNKDKQKEKDQKAAIPLPMARKEIDIVEEQKRSFKEREIKQRMEKQEQENQRLAEAKEQQFRMNRINTEVKSKNFTFDYEGNIIMLQQLRIEKLPPTSYQLSYGIEDVKSQAQTKDKFKPDTSKQGSDKQQKVTSKESQKQIAANKQKKQIRQDDVFTLAPPIYETFVPNTGVTFIESGKVKTGPKPQISALNLLNYSQMTGSDPSQIRLSKNDYLNLIRSGNLSRQAQPQQNFGKSQDQQLEIGNEKSKLLTTSIQQEAIEESIIEKDQINIKGANFDQSMRNDKSKIQVANVKFFDELLEASTQSNEPKQPDKFPKLNKPETQQLNAYDQFNMNILRLKGEWGLSTQDHRFLPSLPSYKKPDEESFSRTLQASTKKLPRARFRKQVVLDAGLDLERPKHFPAPMVGQVMGHGFYSTKSMYSKQIDLSHISNQLLSTKNQ